MCTLLSKSIAIEEYLPTSFAVTIEDTTHAPLKSVAYFRSSLVSSK